MVPFGVLYAWDFAKHFPTADDYEENIDSVLTYLGRYGYQDMTRMEHEPTVKLRKWAKRIDKFIDDERQQMEDARK